MLKFFVFLSVLCLTQADVPVLLFGTSLPFKVPALKSLATEEFSNLVTSQITDKTVTVVFVEPELKIEDLTHCKKSNGVTCFENLNGIQEKSYLPRVSEPVEGLYDVNEKNSEAVPAENVISVAGAGKIIFVNFDPVSKKKDYAEHDKIIGEIYAELAKKFENIVVIYTGRASDGLPKVRKARQADPKTNAVNWNIIKGPHFAIAAEKIVKLGPGPTDKTESTITAVTSTLTENNLEVNLATTGDPITLNFVRNLGNWALTGAKVNNKAVIGVPRYLFAAERYSMRCGEGLPLPDPEDKVTYYIENSQFLPVFKDGESLDFDKNRVVHCNGYWTPGILAGIFVVLILLLIIVWGLSFIMDINTMDKFEDPKGKTITINASE